MPENNKRPRGRHTTFLKVAALVSAILSKEFGITVNAGPITSERCKGLRLLYTDNGIGVPEIKVCDLRGTQTLRLYGIDKQEALPNTIVDKLVLSLRNGKGPAPIATVRINYIKPLQKSSLAKK